MMTHIPQVAYIMEAYDKLEEALEILATEQLITPNDRARHDLERIFNKIEALKSEISDVAYQIARGD